MGKAGRNYVEVNFDLQKLNDELIDLYNAISQQK
jgi:hypothetical protein